MAIQPALLEKGRGNGHGHTQLSSKELSSSFWKGKGWWSWSYRAFFQKLSSSVGQEKVFLEWKGVVVMVIQLSLLEKGRGSGQVTHNLLLRSCLPPLGTGRGGGHGHTEPPSERLSSSVGRERQGGGHGHTAFSSGKAMWLSLLTEPLSEKLSSSAGRGTG